MSAVIRVGRDRARGAHSIRRIVVCCERIFYTCGVTNAVSCMCHSAEVYTPATLRTRDRAGVRNISSMSELTLEHIREAHARIRDKINRTPVMTSHTLDEHAGA